MTLPSTIQGPSLSTRFLLLGIWGYLSIRRRIQLGALLIVMLASGIAELLSLGSAMPFLAVLSNPDLIWQQQLVQVLAPLLGFTEADHLLLPATMVFVVAVLMAAMIRLSTLWLNGRLAAAVGSDLSCEVYRRTLYQPYVVHAQRNSSEVITGTTTHFTHCGGSKFPVAVDQLCRSGYLFASRFAVN